jgi:hypothetical protein
LTVALCRSYAAQVLESVETLREETNRERRGTGNSPTVRTGGGVVRFR